MDLAARRSAPTLALLDGFAIRDARGQPSIEHLPSIPARRLLAYLGVAGNPRTREHLAAVLWPDSTERRAMGNLRVALHAIRQRACGVVDAAHDHLRLADHVEVDLVRLRLVAQQLPGLSLEDAIVHLDGFRRPLLPGWHEDWVLLAQARWDEVRLRALESLACRLSSAGDHGSAVIAGRSAAEIEPLREPTRSIIIRAMAAEGDIGRALREFASFESLLQTELGVSASPELARLAASLRVADRGHA